MQMTSNRGTTLPAAGGEKRSLRQRWAARLLLLIPVALGIGGCGNTGDIRPQSTIDPHTDFAEIIHHLYVSVFWWTAIILAVVWIALAYVLVRFREKPDSPKPRQVHGHLGLEIGWTVAPALIVVAIAIPTIQGVFATQRSAGENPFVVEVTGNQFWWSFHYPEEGITTASELYLPVGRPISLNLDSNDVIHSFWVPLLGGKRDVNPRVAQPEGVEHRSNNLYFTIREPGTYLGQCAEFCGEGHALMRMRVVALLEDDFAEWAEAWRTSTPAVGPGALEAAAEPEAGEETGMMEGNPAALALDDGAAAPQGAGARGQVEHDDELLAMGADVFFNVSYCALCHAIENTPAGGAIGPNLTLYGTRGTLGAGIRPNTQENLVEWLRSPQSLKRGARMPGVSEPGIGITGTVYPPTGLTDEQLEALAAYLLSLR